MKRVGHLWPLVLERGNLVRAYHQAARGKRRKQEVRRFGDDLDTSLDTLRAALLDGTFVLGRYHVFEVRDPKRRTIHAACFEERVFHHALMNVCEPFLERQAVFHSYACRVGKGRLQSIAVAERNARRHPWYLKLDIRQYFASIPHDKLLTRLHRVFKDAELLTWLERIVESHQAGEAGRGLPIGSLCSQHLANFYLSPLDRFCLGAEVVEGYARYMDDFVCWGADRRVLTVIGRDICLFTRGELGLELKHPPCPQPSLRGFDFLGYRVYPNHTRLNRRSKVRYRRKTKAIHREMDAGHLDELAGQRRLTAMTAFLLPASSYQFRSRVLWESGATAIGLEPGEPGRQLEQQRQELPLREPQQQQPDQPQQQPGVPLGPQLRPNPPDGVIRHLSGT